VNAEDIPHIDPATLDLTPRIADLEGIRKFNKQRFEMEMLTAVCELDAARHYIVGYKDVGEDEFWARGHMPGFPLLPGVLMCEAAAQLCSFYVGKTGVIKDNLMGLGGLDGGKFKRMVRPGERLVLVGHGLKVDRRFTRFHTRGYVGSEFAFEVVVVGVPLKTGLG
jgi:3-hydroxyacyl-[acyl-carrier-protein] dehydratase